jgi:hypothetical protein
MRECFVIEVEVVIKILILLLSVEMDTKRKVRKWSTSSLDEKLY